MWYIFSCKWILTVVAIVYCGQHEFWNKFWRTFYIQKAWTWPAYAECESHCVLGKCLLCRDKIIYCSSCYIPLEV